MNRLLISIYYLEGISYTAFDNDHIYQPRLPNLRDPTASYAFAPGREWPPSVDYALHISKSLSCNIY